VGDVFAKWEDRQRVEAAKRTQRRAVTLGGEAERGKGKAGAEGEGSKAGDLEHGNGKGKGRGGAGSTPAADVDEDEEQIGRASRPNNDQDLGPLVVLACRHVYHQRCLGAVQAEDAVADVHHDGREFRCPIDG
jgi:hypothetical protein